MPTPPEGNCGDRIVSCEDETVIEADVETDCAGLAESASEIVKLNVPLTVGIPEITPVDATRERPVGNCPDVIDHVYAGVPPLAPNALAYG